MVLVGQALRSTAMIHASTNFSHSVALHKRDAHRLVTDGVYRSVFSFYRTRIHFLQLTFRWFRHPSYAGFYYWALGTQLVLQNPLTFVLFTILLWRFFYYRTRGQ
jgi:protein-S-isoprenylcysteine O-methyltransferase